MSEKGGQTTRSCLICVCVVLALAVIGLVIGVAIVASQLSELKDNPPDDKKLPNKTSPPGPDDDKPFPAPDQLSLGKFVKAGVTTQHELCNRIGASILARGGSVVDSIIAAEVCIGVHHPVFSGIGGGFFMTVYDTRKGASKREVMTLNAREVAPLAATEDMYVDGNISSVYDGAAVGVPGDVAGLYEAWLQYGRLPWRELLWPSVEMARQGISVSGLLAYLITFQAPGVDVLQEIRKRPEIAAQFLHEDGSPYVEGETMTMSKLADTLEIIATEGPDAFYNGSLTQDIVQDIQDAGGIITAKDLGVYRAEWKAPVSSSLDNGGYTLYGQPPPSSASVIQFMMNILDGYNMSRESDRELLHHRFVEAMKFGFGKRSGLGDADFVDMAEIVANLTSGEFGDEYRARIQDDRVLANVTDYEPAFQHNSPAPASHTSHLSVIGDDGSVVVMTSTINLFFGSMVRGSRTGIIFNNEMDDFSTPGLVNSFGFEPSPTNFIAPRKRPMSSMSPLVVLDSEEGKVRMALGAAGGSRIISSILMTMVQHLWLEEPLDKAVSVPRLHHQLLPYAVETEPNMPQNIIESLRTRGHSVDVFPAFLYFYFGMANAVADTCGACAGGNVWSCDLHCLHASADYRAHTFDKIVKAAMPDGF